MSFHLTQILTGHGYFAKFLCRIGKRINTTCDFCGEDLDDVYHTLKDCPAWDPQRIRLKKELGLSRDFTLNDVVESIVNSLECRRAFSKFAEEVLREKEEEERHRERATTTSSPSIGNDETD
ncbi:reverse transcriptase [Lasius niger]|uniref:Reverse transcriptase n=1 Tax=Lasius niger TaxID=67767 RepID=A0A0J7KIA1_LASNI|nr:reverse transcriptase [Lasius niger]